MELKVWIEGKTLKNTFKFDWKLSFYRQKIDKKKCEMGENPPARLWKIPYLFLFYSLKSKYFFFFFCDCSTSGFSMTAWTWAWTRRHWRQFFGELGIDCLSIHYINLQHKRPGYKFSWKILVQLLKPKYRQLCGVSCVLSAWSSSSSSHWRKEALSVIMPGNNWKGLSFLLWKKQTAKPPQVNI